MSRSPSAPTALFFGTEPPRDFRRLQILERTESLTKQRSFLRKWGSGRFAWYERRNSRTAFSGQRCRLWRQEGLAAAQPGRLGSCPLHSRVIGGRDGAARCCSGQKPGGRRIPIPGRIIPLIRLIVSSGQIARTSSGSRISRTWRLGPEWCMLPSLSMCLPATSSVGESLSR